MCGEWTVGGESGGEETREELASVVQVGEETREELASAVQVGAGWT